MVAQHGWLCNGKVLTFSIINSVITPLSISISFIIDARFGLKTRALLLVTLPMGKDSNMKKRSRHDSGLKEKQGSRKRPKIEEVTDNVSNSADEATSGEDNDGDSVAEVSSDDESQRVPAPSSRSTPTKVVSKKAVKVYNKEAIKRPDSNRCGLCLEPILPSDRVYRTCNWHHECGRR